MTNKIIIKKSTGFLSTVFLKSTYTVKNLFLKRKYTINEFKKCKMKDVQGLYSNTAGDAGGLYVPNVG